MKDHVFHLGEIKRATRTMDNPFLHENPRTESERKSLGPKQKAFTFFYMNCDGFTFRLKLRCMKATCLAPLSPFQRMRQNNRADLKGVSVVVL